MHAPYCCYAYTSGLRLLLLLLLLLLSSCCR
jgi:hypothetical protein